MTTYAFKNAIFIKTAVKASDYPVLRNASGQILPEIAVVGRSNVGKSSLLNHLFQSKNLVKTSASPGKTQALNFFVLNDQIGFVDLPGYGYAQVPPEVRRKWGPMIESYLLNRPSLKLVLFLFDSRRKPVAEDIKLLDWMAFHEMSVILVLTKIDKLNQSDRKANTRKILEAFCAENLYHVQYSTTKNIGRSALIKLIIEALGASDGTD